MWFISVLWANRFRSDKTVSMSKWVLSGIEDEELCSGIFCSCRGLVFPGEMLTFACVVMCMRVCVVLFFFLEV